MASDGAKQTDRNGLPPLNILVVDDDELNQRMMRVLLSREGHNVDVASNGLEAFEMIKARKFDIVFMDLQMPVMDGIAASRKIREWESGNRQTFIVALTASYLPEKGQELFEAGIDNYISKPFELEHVHRMLNYRSEAIRSLSHRADESVAPAGEMSIGEILDIQKGIRSVGGDAETYWELFKDFVEELPEKLGVFERCFAAGDLQGLSRAAHNLRGVSANLGALQLSEHAERLEKQGSEGYTPSLTEDSFKEFMAVGRKLQEVARIFLSGGQSHAKLS